MIMENKLKIDASSTHEFIEYLKKQNIDLIDLVFCDLFGQWQHCTFSRCTIEDLDFGFYFDGSSVKLFTQINSSDLLMVPDISTAWIDPFLEHKTVRVICNVYKPDRTPYERCPRFIGSKAEELLVKSGIGDFAYFGLEPEFFIFDSVEVKVSDGTVSASVNTQEGPWNNYSHVSQKIPGCRFEKKKMYFPVPPIDQTMDIRNMIANACTAVGLPFEKHHHEVGLCQAEIGFTRDTLVKTSDAVMTSKYIAKNSAAKQHKTVTFMPKPLMNDAGSGCHVHISLWKNGENLFYDKTCQFALSKKALHFIGGIFKHVNAICAFTNPTTNSYRRLVPGFEAPSKVSYGEANRSAAIRVPKSNLEKAHLKRIECRFPDGSSCPYLANAVLLLAGIDGIMNSYEPSAPILDNVYNMTDENQLIPSLPSSLLEAVNALEADHEFLTRNDVFPKSFITDYIALKKEEFYSLSCIPHPREFEMYYNN